MKTGILVSDTMSQKPVAITPDLSILAATKVMLEHRVGSLLIIENDVLKGVLTEKDLVRIIAQDMDTKGIPVSAIMTRKLHTIDPNADLGEAIYHMRKNKVRRLPVVYRDRVVGMLTLNDIVKVQPALFEIIAGRASLSMEQGTEKYMEGVCESCENFAQLHEENGQFLCAECLDQQGVDVDE